MIRIFFFVFFILFPALVLLISPPDMSEASDVFVLFDTTGYEQHIEDAISGAKMFINLLDTNDRVGLAALTDKYSISVPLSKLDSNALMTSLDNLTSSGSCSKNLHLAISDTIKYLSSINPPYSTLTLVVISGKSCKEAAFNAEIIDNLIETLNKKQIKVYGMGMVRNNPAVELAAETGGLFIPVAEKESYTSNAVILYEALKSPDLIPFQRGKFIVDESIYEVTIVGEKITKNNKLFLYTPDGKKYINNESPEFVSWHSYNKYDIIRITNPQPGPWTLQFVTGTQNRAYVNSSFKIMSYFDAPYVPVNGKIVFDAWLKMDHLYVKDPDILKSMEFTMLSSKKDEAETETDLRIEKNGNLRGVFRPGEEGLYRIMLNASSKTLTRGKSFVVIAEKEFNTASRTLKRKQKKELTFTEAVVVFLSVNLIFLTAAWGYLRKDDIKVFLHLLSHTFSKISDVQVFIQQLLHRKKQAHKNG
ncbi:MAG: hypothetical protein HQK92_10405 [Nitrospirae bacterium]|nr:hypothetical protein [Nitrospirota bacterium]